MLLHILIHCNIVVALFIFFISYKAAIKALDDGILVCKKNPMSGAELYGYKSIIMQKGTEAVFTKKNRGQVMFAIYIALDNVNS